MTSDGSCAPGQQDRRQQLVMASAVAGAVYVVLNLLDGFVAYPLRLNSSKLAAFLLNSLAVEVSRDGTILSTPNFTFDVVPACSGSTTLRVLGTLAVMWCMIHRRLSWPRKMLCALLAIPIALLANGVRVAALVGLGDILLHPVEGALHALIGVCTFVLGMGGVVLLTESLSSQHQQTALQTSHKLALLGVILALIYLPIWIWFYDTWRTIPRERHGMLFVALGAGALIFWWRRGPRQAPAPRSGLALFIAASLLMALGTLLDVRTIQAWALLAALLALAVWFRGWEFALPCVPLLGIAYLGFPMVSAFLAQVLPRSVSMNLTLPQMLVKGVLAGGLAAVFWLSRSRAWLQERFPRTAKAEPFPLAKAGVRAALITAFASLVLQGLLNSQASYLDREAGLQLSYVQGEWVGVDNPITDMAIEVIGRQRILSRRYEKNGRVVNLIVTSTGTDRRRAHPPEGCMTGAGWRIKDRSLTRKVVGGRSTPMTRFLFVRGEDEVEFFYWFTDGEVAFATYHEMLKADLARRLKGTKTDWMLFRVFAGMPTNGIDDFLAVLDTRCSTAASQAKTASPRPAG